MHILNFIVLLIVLLIKSGHSEEDCSIGNGKLCTEEKEFDRYSKDLNERYHKYYAAIEDAEKVFKPCNNTNCACFTEVITRDLKPFKKKGITKELIETARNRGTFYQIIDGKLYRQKDCMFPSRCAGIEYFILKHIINLPDMDLVINTRDYPQSGKHFGAPLPIFSFSKHGHFGKVDLLFHYILEVLVDGMSIVYR